MDNFSKRTRLAAAACLAVVAAAVAPSSAASAATWFKGELWVLPISQLTNSYAPPTTTPDATFFTSHLSFWDNRPFPGSPQTPLIHANVALFLGSADPVSNLTFSGAVNPTIGQQVGPNTYISNGNGSRAATYGIFLRFTGTLNLKYAEQLVVSHSDGASATVDGSGWGGLSSASGGPRAERFFFEGQYPGLHAVSFLYTSYSEPAYFSVSPAM